jgi:endoglucanase
MSTRPNPLWLALGVGAVFSVGCIGVSQKKEAGVQPDRPGMVGGAQVKKCSSAKAVPAPDGLLDDFEDENNQVVIKAGRDGYWWKSQDEFSQIGPANLKSQKGGADGTGRALHVVGSTGSETGAWGVNVGANFSTQGLYDASKYAGIRFMAKAGKDSVTGVRLKIGDVNTHPDNGVCKDCWNHFGKDIYLTHDWKEYKVMFWELKQAEGWGDPRPPSIVPNKLYNIDFTVGPGAKSFDIWFDDIAFLECGD